MGHEDLGLGKLITTPQKRDAIHVAVAPVVCGDHSLNPGQHVGFIGLDTSQVSGVAAKKVGIVDPFLAKPAEKGDHFWLFLYPNSITSLRHDWTHPEIERIENDYAVQWLTEFAREGELTLDRLMEGAREYLRTGDSLCLGTDTPDRYWREYHEFWRHFTHVTGQAVPDEKVDSFFRCAC